MPTKALPLDAFVPEDGTMVAAHSIFERFNSKVLCARCLGDPVKPNHTFIRDNSGNHKGLRYRRYKPSGRSHEGLCYYKKKLNSEEYINNAFEYFIRARDTSTVYSLNKIIASTVDGRKDQKLKCGRLEKIQKRWASEVVSLFTEHGFSDHAVDGTAIEQEEERSTCSSPERTTSTETESRGELDLRCLTDSPKTVDLPDVLTPPTSHQTPHARKRKAVDDGFEESPSGSKRRGPERFSGTDELTFEDWLNVDATQGASEKRRSSRKSIATRRARAAPPAPSRQIRPSPSRTEPVNRRASRPHEFHVDIYMLGDEIQGLTGPFKVTRTTTARQLATFIESRVPELDMSRFMLEYDDKCIWNGHYQDREAGVHRPLTEGVAQLVQLGRQCLYGHKLTNEEYINNAYEWFALLEGGLDDMRAIDGILSTTIAQHQNAHLPCNRLDRIRQMWAAKVQALATGLAHSTETGDGTTTGHEEGQAGPSTHVVVDDAELVGTSDSGTPQETSASVSGSGHQPQSSSVEQGNVTAVQPQMIRAGIADGSEVRIRPAKPNRQLYNVQTPVTA
ncbi:hypothetical protein PRZ48_008633 [Zasmidium cellare]|uniref:Uncharacterized protein n=1 Tax=Zasmidium cellare TaxID=395010 RepID=A0ABR0EGE4_ZASCE|nr:hypothetical protein PRZ48_008633 [Zasmidium cellare]